MSVQEFKPIARIAWGGFPKVSEASKACHAWMITATQKGCNLWTGESMHGPYWIELKKAPDAVWRTHQMLLEALAKVANETERQLSDEPPKP